MNNIEENIKKTRGRPKKQQEDKIKPDANKYYKTFTAKHNEKINCECGGHYSYYSKSKHLQSKQHKKHTLGDKDFIKQQIDNLTKIYEKL